MDAHVESASENEKVCVAQSFPLCRLRGLGPPGSRLPWLTLPPPPSLKKIKLELLWVKFFISKKFFKNELRFNIECAQREITKKILQNHFLTMENSN